MSRYLIPSYFFSLLGVTSDLNQSNNQFQHDHHTISIKKSETSHYIFNLISLLSCNNDDFILEQLKIDFYANCQHLFAVCFELLFFNIFQFSFPLFSVRLVPALFKNRSKQHLLGHGWTTAAETMSTS